jgi:hypothetical protein
MPTIEILLTVAPIDPRSWYANTFDYRAVK